MLHTGNPFDALIPIMCTYKNIFNICIYVQYFTRTTLYDQYQYNDMCNNFALVMYILFANDVISCVS